MCETKQKKSGNGQKPNRNTKNRKPKRVVNKIYHAGQLRGEGGWKGEGGVDSGSWHAWDALKIIKNI